MNNQNEDMNINIDGFVLKIIRRFSERNRLMRFVNNISQNATHESISEQFIGQNCFPPSGHSSFYVCSKGLEDGQFDCNSYPNTFECGNNEYFDCTFDCPSNIGFVCTKLAIMDEKS